MRIKGHEQIESIVASFIKTGGTAYYQVAVMPDFCFVDIYFLFFIFSFAWCIPEGEKAYQVFVIKVKTLVLFACEDFFISNLGTNATVN